MNAAINEMINRISNGDYMYLGMLAVILFVVIALVFGVRYLLESRVDVVAERLKRSITVRESSIPPPPAPLGDDDAGRSFFSATARGVASVAKPMNDEEMGRLRAGLSHAGFRSERAVLTYLAAKVVLSLVLVGLLFWFNSSRPQPLQNLLFFMLLVMMTGFYLPNLWLRQRISKRQREIDRGMPDTLDLLVTCVESGLGLDAAMNRVAEEIALSTPLLSMELRQAALEIGAGSSRGDAFRRLAERTGVEDVRNLSSIIVQTEKFGTSIAKALRIMADSMRVRRMQKAEEKAATVAVKMTIPLVLCIFPALITVIVGPAIIKIYYFLQEGMGK